ncbi:MAG TPA: hemerythrin domain-containing protein [Burkholderiaceae bacterium]|nr:hemerythrin domain-containing protein [Burkholderiaceae bacterium]
MSALPWSDALALNEPHLDGTHQEFVELLGALERSLAAESSQPPASALQALIAHCESHFGMEEVWMRAMGFEDGNCHFTQHRQVLEVARDVLARIGTEPAEEVQGYLERLVLGLAEWFPMHAQQMDAALVYAMQELKFDPQTAALSAA